MRRLATTAARKRAVLVAPGRGSYNSAELGTLRRLPFSSTWEGLVSAADARCAAAGMTRISELDSTATFQRSVHLEAAHSSALTYTCTVASMRAFSRAARRWEPVGIVGNSLGWYSAVHIAGCVGFEQGLDIVLRTGGYQREAGILGGQLVYPALDVDTWQRSECLDDAMRAGLAAANAAGGFASVSIDLGGMVVLAADGPGLVALKRALPTLTRGRTRFPLELPGHSAFHTPLMAPMAAAAREAAAEFAPPSAMPLVDGNGRLWRTHALGARGAADAAANARSASPLRMGKS